MWITYSVILKPDSHCSFSLYISSVIVVWCFFFFPFTAVSDILVPCLYLAAEQKWEEKEEVSVYRLRQCFHWVLGRRGVYKCSTDKTSVGVNTTDRFVSVSSILYERVFICGGFYGSCVRVFVFGAFSVIMASAAECFLSINTGRGCLACETSVMQQLTAYFYGKSGFWRGLSCFCCSHSSSCAFHCVTYVM